jgi:hypothetical protein
MLVHRRQQIEQGILDLGAPLSWRLEVVLKMDATRLHGERVSDAVGRSMGFVRASFGATKGACGQAAALR